MIETFVLSCLNNAGIDAAMEIPEAGIIPPYCIVEKTGGGVIAQLRHATIAVQSYGASLYLAAQLNGRVIDAMAALPARPEIARCQLNSDYAFPDPGKHKYRYQAVFDIIYYE